MALLRGLINSSINVFVFCGVSLSHPDIVVCGVLYVGFDLGLTYVFVHLLVLLVFCCKSISHQNIIGWVLCLECVVYVCFANLVDVFVVLCCVFFAPESFSICVVFGLLCVDLCVCQCGCDLCVFECRFQT